MKFSSTRKLVLAAFGHVITFEKNDTQFVPRALHQLALEQGLDPVPEGDEDTPERVVAPDDSARVEAIKTAMQLIAERNRSDDFTAGGIPKIKAIEALTDGQKPIDAREHQALWAEVVASVKA